MSSHDPDGAAAELERVRAQLHIYEAVAVASNDPHSTLDAILSSPDPDAARRALHEHFGFSEIQALAVMDLQFRRVTALDREKIHQRRRELTDTVLDLEGRSR
jgi:DNA gyrase/topoisomerase IV subunit A